MGTPVKRAQMFFFAVHEPDFDVEAEIRPAKLSRLNL